MRKKSISGGLINYVREHHLWGAESLMTIVEVNVEATGARTRYRSIPRQEL